MASNKKPSWRRDLAYYVFIHPPVIIGIFFLSLLIGAACEMVLREAFVNRVLGTPPFYPVEIALGFEIGFLVNRSLRSKSACFVWVIGSLWLWVDIQHSMQMGGLHAVYAYLTGGDCQNCIEQLFVIAPFQITVAYSLGSLLALKWANWKSDRRVVSAETSSPATTEPSTSEESELP